MALSTFVAEQIDTAKAIIAGIPKWILAVPVVLFAFCYALTHTPLVWVMDKQVQETAAMTVAGLSAFAALMMVYWTRNAFCALVASFTLVLAFREFHIEDSDGVAYISLVTLAIIAGLLRHKIARHASAPAVAAFFCAAIATFLLTDAMDRHFLLVLEPLLGPGTHWENRVEETLETMGHMLVFGFVISSLRIATLIEISQELRNVRRPT